MASCLLGIFVEDDEGDVGGTPEGGQQVIQIDDSLPSVAGMGPSESLSSLKAENEKLRAQLAKASFSIKDSNLVHSTDLDEFYSGCV